MRTVDCGELFNGEVLVLVPHMDDCVLGSGGTVLQAPDRSRIHFVYCTDGRGETSSRYYGSWTRGGGEDIGLVRMNETKRAMEVLGIDAGRLNFLKFPEWELRNREADLRSALQDLIRVIRPRHVLAPFRYDKHTDHVTLSRVARELVSNMTPRPELLEYFVYFQWKLLPSGDIRRHMNPGHLLRSDISAVSGKKKEALRCFVSQTTAFFPWQHKPVLSAELVDMFSAGPEMFLKAPDLFSDSGLFTIPVPVVRFLNALEPVLKKSKEKLLSARHNLLRRGDKCASSP